MGVWQRLFGDEEVKKMRRDRLSLLLRMKEERLLKLECVVSADEGVKDITRQIEENNNKIRRHMLANELLTNSRKSHVLELEQKFNEEFPVDDSEIEELQAESRSLTGTSTSNRFGTGIGAIGMDFDRYMQQIMRVQEDAQKHQKRYSNSSKGNI